MKVYIKGAYGPANIGDDLLLMVTRELLIKAFPTATLYTTFTEPELGKKVYPDLNFIERVDVESSDIDLVVHGGGGQFFSFADSSQKGGFDPLIVRLAKRALSAKGRKRIAGGIKSVFKKQHVVGGNAISRVGIGMGVGPFVPNSRREDEAKEILDTMGFITVRENASLKDYNRVCDKGLAKLGCDLSLYRHHWIEDDRLIEIRNSVSGRKCVGICMRSWHQADLQDKVCEVLISYIEHLKANGWDVLLLGICWDTDAHWMQSLPECEQLNYMPTEGGIKDYLAELKKRVSVVVSARAHVTILSSQVGIPTISIPIERKLYWANSLRGHEAGMWGEDLSLEELITKTELFEETKDEIVETVCKQFDTLHLEAQKEEIGIIEELRKFAV